MLRHDHLRVPDPRRLTSDRGDFAEIMRRHDAAIAAGEASYQDPASGMSVFTAAFLAANESCCRSGCRHCPYSTAFDD